MPARDEEKSVSFAVVPVVAKLLATFPGGGVLDLTCVLSPPSKPWLVGKDAICRLSFSSAL